MEWLYEFYKAITEFDFYDLSLTITVWELGIEYHVGSSYYRFYSGWDVNGVWTNYSSNFTKEEFFDKFEFGVM
jgi:hypothetical protein